jgi:hypothetical protein
MKTNQPAKSSEPEFIVVYTSNGPLGAELTKGRLESAGIPAMLKYESAGRVYGFTLDGMGQVQVLVSKTREREARELLATPAPDE